MWPGRWWQRDSERRTFFATDWLSVDQFDFFVELRWKRAWATVIFNETRIRSFSVKFTKTKKTAPENEIVAECSYGLNIMHVSCGIQQNAWCAVLHQWKQERIRDSERYLCVSCKTNGKMPLLVFCSKFSILILIMTFFISISIEGYGLRREIITVPIASTVSTLIQLRHQSTKLAYEIKEY